LNLSAEDGEKWIVTLVRETRSDAKIDFNKVFYNAFYPANLQGIVMMNHPQQSVYQQVIERTKGLHLDSTVMSQSIRTLKSHTTSAASASAS
jgi:translation initiation factor 3 subunit E